MGKRGNVDNRLGNIFSRRNRIISVKTILKLLSPFENIALIDELNRVTYIGEVQLIPERYLYREVTAMQAFRPTQYSRYQPLLKIYYKDES